MAFRRFTVAEPMELWSSLISQKTGRSNRKHVNHTRAKHWKESVASQVCLDDGAPLPVMLLINKYDKVEEDEKRSEEEKKFKKQTIGMQPSQLEHFINNYYFVGWRWVSAKTGENVESAFDGLLD